MLSLSLLIIFCLIFLNDYSIELTVTVNTDYSNIINFSYLSTTLEF